MTKHHPSPPLFYTRKKFTSYERDNEAELDFAEARYYNYNHGRFTSVDPENAGAELTDPQSWNGYSYSLNNPLSFIDPDGLKPIWLSQYNSDGVLTDVMRADDEADGFQGLLDGGWQRVQYNANGEFQYTSTYRGETRNAILTGDGNWRWGDYQQSETQSDPTTNPSLGRITPASPVETLPRPAQPPTISPQTPTAPTLPPVAPAAGSGWLLRILQILGVPGIILGSPLECCRGSERPSPAPLPIQPEMSKKKKDVGPADNDESTKEHRKKGDWQKHTKPRPGRRTTKDRQKWDRNWRPRKKQ